MCSPRLARGWPCPPFVSQAIYCARSACGNRDRRTGQHASDEDDAESAELFHRRDLGEVVQGELLSKRKKNGGRTVGSQDTINHPERSTRRLPQWLHFGEIKLCCCDRRSGSSRSMRKSRRVVSPQSAQCHARQRPASGAEGGSSRSNQRGSMVRGIEYIRLAGRGPDKPHSSDLGERGVRRPVETVANRLHNEETGGRTFSYIG